MCVIFGWNFEGHAVMLVKPNHVIFTRFNMHMHKKAFEVFAFDIDVKILGFIYRQKILYGFTKVLN